SRVEPELFGQLVEMRSRLATRGGDHEQKTAQALALVVVSVGFGRPRLRWRRCRCRRLRGRGRLDAKTRFERPERVDRFLTGLRRRLDPDPIAERKNQRDQAVEVADGQFSVVSVEDTLAERLAAGRQIER